MVIRSVCFTELASGVLMGLPKLSPGSTAGNVVLHFGNVSELATRAGRFTAETPPTHPEPGVPVFGMAMPPTGMPVPA